MSAIEDRPPFTSRSPMDHYQAAEKLLARADDCAVASITRQLTARANVHAMLAQVPLDDWLAHKLHFEALPVPKQEPTGGMVTADIRGDVL